MRTSTADSGVAAVPGMGSEQPARLHQQPYRRDIDGLRSIAVASVVVYHAVGAALPGGFVGVDIFFVISGFLIGGIIHRDVRDRRFRFAAFYARRARRILPALIALILAFLALGAVFYTGGEYRELAFEAVSSLIGLSNFQFWLRNDYFASAAPLVPLLMTWSLGIEEQFYVLLPAILGFTGRTSDRVRFLVIAALTLLSLAASVYMTAYQPWGSYYLLPSRAWELGAGVLLALWHDRGDRIFALSPRIATPLGLAGLALVLAAMLLFDDGTPFPGWAALLPVAGTLALIAGANGWFNRTVLSSAPFVFVGLVSYSWYLWHWPMISIVHAAAPAEPARAATIGAAALSFPIAILSWRFVERPFRTAAASNARTLTIAAAAVIAVAGLAMAIALSGGVPGRLSPLARTVDAQRAGEVCQVSYGAREPTGDPRCLPAPSDAPIVALMGDSHADVLHPTLRTLLARRGRELWNFEKSACMPLAGVTTGDLRRLDQAGECADYLAAATEAVLAEPRVETVVLAGAWPARDDERLHAIAPDGSVGAALPPEVGLARGLGAMIAKLRAAGKTVIVVGDVPHFGAFDPLRAARIRAMPLRARVSMLASGGAVDADYLRYAELDDRFDRTRRIVADAAARGGAGYVDIADALCDAKGCRHAVGGVPLFIDVSHLSPTGAALVLSRMDCLAAGSGPLRCPAPSRRR